jgi:DNA-binding response OmpR family regulator
MEDRVRTILIVEDNYMIADMVEDTLIANGYEVCGIAGSIAEGLALYQQYKPGLVIIDLRLGNGELGTQLIPKISPIGEVGILYVTGNSCEFQLSRDDGHACLSKPYRSSDLLQAIKIVTELAQTGKATPPFPAGFHLLEQLKPARRVVA